jgi:hypothetical protein
MGAIMRQQVLISAVETFGEKRQIIKAIEEMAELQQCLARYLLGNTDAGTVMHLKEELADARIMLDQMAHIFGGHELAVFDDVKVKRLASIVEGERREQQRSRN